MNVKIKADNISEKLRMDTIIPGSIISILDRIKRISKEMRVLAARSELTSINIEFHADCTHRVNQRQEELLKFLLQSRAPRREGHHIRKAVAVGVKVSLEDLKTQRIEEEGVREVDLHKDCGFEEYPMKLTLKI